MKATISVPCETVWEIHALGISKKKLKKKMKKGREEIIEMLDNGMVELASAAFFETGLDDFELELEDECLDLPNDVDDLTPGHENDKHFYKKFSEKDWDEAENYVERKEFDFADFEKSELLITRKFIYLGTQSVEIDLGNEDFVVKKFSWVKKDFEESGPFAHDLIDWGILGVYCIDGFKYDGKYHPLGSECLTCMEEDIRIFTVKNGSVVAQDYVLQDELSEVLSGD